MRNEILELWKRIARWNLKVVFRPYCSLIVYEQRDLWSHGNSITYGNFFYSKWNHAFVFIFMHQNQTAWKREREKWREKSSLHSWQVTRLSFIFSPSTTSWNRKNILYILRANMLFKQTVIVPTLCLGSFCESFFLHKKQLVYTFTFTFSTLHICSYHAVDVYSGSYLRGFYIPSLWVY